MKVKKFISVRFKIIIAIFISIALLSLLIYFVSTSILLKSYENIEREEMAQDVERANDAISNVVTQLSVKLSDWAWWDDSYQFIQDKNQAYVESNLNVESIANLKINTMVFMTNAGEVVFKRLVDLKTAEEISSENLGQYMSTHEIFRISDPEVGVRGIIVLPEGPMLITTLPILSSRGSGPTYGTVSFGRFLDEDLILEIKELTHLSINIFPYEDSALPKDIVTAKAELLKGKSMYTAPISSDLVAGYSILSDIYGKPIFVLRVEITRDVYNQGLKTFYSFMGIAAIAIIFFGILIIFLVDILFISRLLYLSKEVNKVGETRDFSLRVEEGTRDEIGALAFTINQTLNELSISREKEEQAKKHVLQLLKNLEEEKKKVEGVVVERTYQLNEEKARLVSSINSLSFGLIIADMDNNILFKNKAMSGLFNLEDNEQFSVNNIFELLGEHFNVRAQIEMCLRGRRICEIKEIAFGAKFLRGIIAPVLAGEKMIGYVFLLEDITEARVMERSKEEFFAVASHELRTPLTAIRGNAEMILDMYAEKVVDKDVREMLADIKQASVRLIGIVNDFLDASRLEQGTVSLNVAKFDVTEIIDKVIKSLEETVREKNLTLDFKNREQAPVFVLADKDKVEQVLFNLIGNAIKFTLKGGVIIETSISGGFVKISVKDTGPGISPEASNLLFRKFQPAGEQILARDVTKSTGLGLYISRLLVSKMGGTIGLEKSLPGEGSIFAFTLPVVS